MSSDVEHEDRKEAFTDPAPGSIPAMLDALRSALAAGDAAAGQAAFVAAVEAAFQTAIAHPEDVHWRLHELALACSDAAGRALEHGELDAAVGILRIGLKLRRRLADLEIRDDIFREVVDAPVELAASHFAIAQAYRRTARLAEALGAMRAGIAAYRHDVEATGDAYALDTLAAHVEDAGRIARDIPDRRAMRDHFSDSLALRERAARQMPEDADLARTFIEACVWRAPDLGRASADWLDRARRLLTDREAGAHPVPGTRRLHNLVDTAGAPYLST